MKFLTLIFMFLLSTEALSELKVITTTTDLAWAAKEIGGEHVEVKSLLDGSENAHYVDAVPDFIRLVASADIVCAVGLDLEIGWLPKVLSKSGNAKVQPGGKGYCEAGPKIQVLDKPKGDVDRSMGDVHPAGNPHFWLSPDTMIQGVEAVLDVLVAADSKNAGYYLNRWNSLKKRIVQMKKQLLARLQDAVKKSGSPKFIQYHTDFTYFMKAYGLYSIGSIEEKPGVPPSAGRIARVAINARKAGVHLALALDTNPARTLEKFSEMAKIKVLRLPGASRPASSPADYFALQKFYVDQIIAGLK